MANQEAFDTVTNGMVAALARTLEKQKLFQPDRDEDLPVQKLNGNGKNIWHIETALPTKTPPPTVKRSRQRRYPQQQFSR